MGVGCIPFSQASFCDRVVCAEINVQGSKAVQSAAIFVSRVMIFAEFVIESGLFAHYKATKRGNFGSAAVRGGFGSKWGNLQSYLRRFNSDPSLRILQKRFGAFFVSRNGSSQSLSQ